MVAAIVLFAVFLALSAFFSSSETAFVAVSPYRLEYLEKTGSKRARLARRVLERLNDLLATILIGNTLANVAAASVATSLVASLVRNPNTSVAVATIGTTLLILFFAEMNPKSYAARHPARTVLLFVRPIRVLMALLFPAAKAFTFLTGLVQPSSRRRAARPPLEDEEIRILLRSNAPALSALRRKIVTGAFEIGRRPVKEVMVPRPLVRGIEIESSLDEVLETLRAAGYSRYPVYRGRLDNVEGLLHVQDLVPFLIDRTGFHLSRVIRPPIFVPELASQEKALQQMQEKAVHLAMVVDEFGNLEGVVSLEDVIEEIVGEIRDEHDAAQEDWLTPAGARAVLVKGSAPVSAVNERMNLDLPERSDYTTVAGFFLDEFGRIPREQDHLEYHGARFTVEKMSKRRIHLLRIDPGPGRRPEDA